MLARSESDKIALWKHRIKKRLCDEDYQNYEKAKKDARDYYSGKLIPDEYRKDWGGDTVELNMWRRILTYFVDALFSQNPNFVVRPRPGRDSAALLPAASAVEDFIRYTWDETAMDEECRRVLKDAYFGNVSAAKWDWDIKRGLPRMRWITGKLIVDPGAHGDLSRARWVVEEMEVSILRILQDDTFPIEKRQRYAAKLGLSPDQDNSAFLDRVRKLYYVYTREGDDPVACLDVFGVQQYEKNKLIVFVEDSEEYLYEADKPHPWLDDDEFPFAIMRVDEMPGEFFGSPLWTMLHSMVNALNWIMSYAMTTMRKQATTLVGVNKEIIDNPRALATKSHMEIIPCNGPPEQAAAPLNMGKGQVAGSLQEAESVMEWLDRLSGMSEIVRGESSGRKTAEEARYLQTNATLILKGPAIALDRFLETCVKYIGLSGLYYIPSFNRQVAPDGMIIAGVAQDVPVMSPHGQPAVDPMGKPMMQKQVMQQPVSPDEAKSLGAQEWKNDLGQNFGFRAKGTQASIGMDGNPMFQHPQPGQVLRPGVENILGPESAANWPVMNLEEVKRNFLLSFEAGSTRAEWRYDQQQMAQAAMQVLGNIYQMAGFADQFYELLLAYTRTLNLPDTHRLIPSREVFVAQFTAAMQMQAAAQQNGNKEGKSEQGQEKGE